MIKIRDCDEPLVDIQKYCPHIQLNLKLLSTAKEKKAYARKRIAIMLSRAQAFLPKGYSFLINDAWHPVLVQKGIFDQYLKQFSQRHSSWPKRKIVKEVRKYVAPFSGPRASGHLTGAAVDLRLVKNGRRVPMSYQKLSFQEDAKSIQPKLPAYLRKNREMMYIALTKAGFTNYPKEFWHWCWGDSLWARLTHQKRAVYGIINKK